MLCWRRLGNSEENLCVLTKVSEVDIKSGEMDNFFSGEGKNTANQPFLHTNKFLLFTTKYGII